MEIHSAAISKLIYFFLKLSVTIRFTEERFLLPESLEQWETGGLTKASEEDLYWGYNIIVNGYSSAWYYSQKIFNLRGIFYKELFEALVSRDESNRKHFLYYLRKPSATYIFHGIAMSGIFGFKISHEKTGA